MPLLVDPLARTDVVLAAACALILREGVRALTLRAVARESRLSPASLVHHYTSAERLDRVLGRRYGHLWADRQALASRTRGLHALVPRDDEEVEEARIWLAWCEVARARASLAPAVCGVRDEQSRLVTTLLGPDPDDLDVELTFAVVEGLATACCAPGEPLRPARAQAVLTRFLELVPPPERRAAQRER